MSATSEIESTYENARERYAAVGVDTENALRTLARTPIALNCWQGDDLHGFEWLDETLSTGGIQVTGGYPGRARTIDELRADVLKACSLIPGPLRLNLHAMYGDFGNSRVDRDAIRPEHFSSWIEWGKAHRLPLDFNATCFSHPRAESGFTLSSTDRETRAFWIEHVRQCREISADIGRRQGSACIHDLWIPDGSKDTTVNRFLHRRLLKESLDSIFTVSYDPRQMKDALESKLFGIGSESYVVGSHEFYLGYALLHGIMLCMDMGHFHPTESVADKVSAILQYADELLIHVSRGVRWDSDHVVVLNDDIRALMEEIVRSGATDRVHFALDYFDASINRIGAWVIGARATLKALLLALLEPVARLRDLEQSGNLFARLATMEEMKSLPAGAVWEYYCLQSDVPRGETWLADVQQYETTVLSGRT